ncbi:unnamed protein product [Angiostrongylus costaricensis]|uniref:ATP-dependent RNA helicase n=1 Tax=Angiostrongylus costaricensis TaxID=334426 RepID=A0A158PJK0_ANGCS|nr:unnamed protein product [Angiostrongylus costaricensis]
MNVSSKAVVGPGSCGAVKSKALPPRFQTQNDLDFLKSEVAKNVLSSSEHSISRLRRIQKYMIPLVLNEISFLAIGPSGSGKTCGYLLPLINKLIELKEMVVSLEFVRFFVIEDFERCVEKSFYKEDLTILKKHLSESEAIPVCIFLSNAVHEKGIFDINFMKELAKTKLTKLMVSSLSDNESISCILFELPVDSSSNFKRRLLDLSAKLNYSGRIHIMVDVDLDREKAKTILTANSSFNEESHLRNEALQFLEELDQRVPEFLVDMLSCVGEPSTEVELPHSSDVSNGQQVGAKPSVEFGERHFIGRTNTPLVLILGNTQNLMYQTFKFACSMAGYEPYAKVARCGVRIFDLFAGKGTLRLNRMDTVRDEIVVATTGGVLKGFEQNKLDFSNLEMLIIDEFDKMVDEVHGFGRDLYQILAKIPARPTVAGFSATLSDENSVRTLSDLELKLFRRLRTSWRLRVSGGISITLTKFSRPALIKQRFIAALISFEIKGNRNGAEKAEYLPNEPYWECGFTKNLSLLVGLIESDLALHKMKKGGPYKKSTVIFVERKRTSNYLALFLLQIGYDFEPMNASYKYFYLWPISTAKNVTKTVLLDDIYLVGLVLQFRDYTLDDNETTLRRMKTGKIQGVVATNKLARGQDIPEVDHVIIYEMSTDFSDYKHRIGRTGRMGRGGRSTVMLSSKSDRALVNPLVRKRSGLELPFAKDYWFYRIVPTKVPSLCGGQLVANYHDRVALKLDSDQ